MVIVFTAMAKKFVLIVMEDISMPTFTDDEERAITEFLARLTAFEKRESEDCPICKVHVTSLYKQGRCVFCHPCGDRLWQGQIPAAWKGWKQNVNL